MHRLNLNNCWKSFISKKEQGCEESVEHAYELITISERNHPKMNQDFFKDLPSEIIIDILSRLPVRTVISCKCVCKSWLDLLATREFAKQHLSNSSPGLAIYPKPEWNSTLYKIFEFEDVLDLDHHELHYNLVAQFEFPRASIIRGSANGLVLLSSCKYKPDALYIWNPITRDFIHMHCPYFVDTAVTTIDITFGFGVSKTTGQYKVVRIYRVFIINDDTFTSYESVSDFDCQVYTLGTRSWRSIELDATLYYHYNNNLGVFLNGNLHWLALNPEDVPLISCLDLETELFSTFSLPSFERREQYSLYALEYCLCICAVESRGGVVVWLMKEYGDERSWTKEYIISNIPHFVLVRPIKVFKDGDLLLAWEGHFLFYHHYSKKTKSIRKIDMIQVRCRGPMGAILHTSSFLSLKSFTNEDVISF